MNEEDQAYFDYMDYVAGIQEAEYADYIEAMRERDAERAEMQYRYSLWMKHTKVKPENINLPLMVVYYDNRLLIEMYVSE